MKLSELVLLKNQLEVLSSVPIQNHAMSELYKITYLVNSYSLKSSINEDRHSIDETFTRFENSLNQVKENIKESIIQAEKPWFQESYKLYEGELDSQPHDILNLRKHDNSNSSFFQSRLKVYADWRYSAMIIRPGLETYIEDMVAYDPLYVIDLDREYLQPALDKFNEHYQNRLRCYTVNEQSTNEILEKIPDNQFGMCFAYNYFNFRPFDIIKKYLSEVHRKLKPGGVFILTFNDCDRVSAVKLVENYYCCYTPGYLVKQLAESMGYEIAYSWNDDGPTTWLELKKPGELTTIKGGQSLAKILPKPL